MSKQAPRPRHTARTRSYDDHLFACAGESSAAPGHPPPFAPTVRPGRLGKLLPTQAPLIPAKPAQDDTCRPGQHLLVSHSTPPKAQTTRCSARPGADKRP